MVWPSPRARRRLSVRSDVGPSPARRAVTALLMGAVAGVVVAALVPRASGRGGHSASHAPSAPATG